MQHVPAQFENRAIRRVYDEARSTWWFSVVDIISVLTDSPNPAGYWRVLKKRLKDEGNETVTNCNALKMMAADGKQRLTDVADAEQLLRLVQSQSPTQRRKGHSLVISAISASPRESRSVFFTRRRGVRGGIGYERA